MKSTIFFILYLSILGPNHLLSQEYIRAIGGLDYDIGRWIVQDEEQNSLVITGSTNSFGNGYSDAIILKYKLNTIYPYLDFEWAKFIGNEGTDHAFCVQVDQYGYYVICGMSQNTANGDYDILLAKTKFYGDVKFENIYDVNGVGQTDIAKSFAIDNDNNYIIVGTTYCEDSEGDILIAKFQSDGASLWARSIGLKNVPERGKAIIQGSNGQYVIVGNTGNADSTDIVIATFNGITGDMQNSVRLDGINHHEDMPWAIVDVPLDTSYTIAGYTRSLESTDSPDSSLHVFKINHELDAIYWSKVLKRDDCAAAKSIMKTPSDEFIVSGYSQKYLSENSRDVIFAQFAFNGFLRGAKTFSSILELKGREEAICVTNIYNPDNNLRGYVSTGFTETSVFGASEIFVNTFNHESACCYDNIEVDIFDMPLSINQFTEAMRKSLTITDTLRNEFAYPDTANICFKEIVTNTAAPNNLPEKFDVYQNYPNPFNPTTEIRYYIQLDAHVELTIFNILGKKVKNLVYKNQPQGFHKVIWNGDDESGQRVTTGVYLFTIKAGDQYEMKKMVMLN